MGLPMHGLHGQTEDNVCAFYECMAASTRLTSRPMEQENSTLCSSIQHDNT